MLQIWVKNDNVNLIFPEYALVCVVVGWLSRVFDSFPLPLYGDNLPYFLINGIEIDTKCC